MDNDRNLWLRLFHVIFIGGYLVFLGVMGLSSKDNSIYSFALYPLLGIALAAILLHTTFILSGYATWKQYFHLLIGILFIVLSLVGLSMEKDGKIPVPKWLLWTTTIFGIGVSGYHGSNL